MSLNAIVLKLVTLTVPAAEWKTKEVVQEKMGYDDKHKYVKVNHHVIILLHTIINTLNLNDVNNMRAAIIIIAYRERIKY